MSEWIKTKGGIEYKDITTNGKWEIIRFRGNAAFYSYCPYCGHTHPCYKHVRGEDGVWAPNVEYDPGQEYNYCPICGTNMLNVKDDIVPYPLDGMIYYVETTEESDEAWVANKPIQYIDEEGYHCGWGLATLCFKFEDLNEVYFFSREEAKVNLGYKEKWL